MPLSILWVLCTDPKLHSRNEWRLHANIVVSQDLSSTQQGGDPSAVPFPSGSQGSTYLFGDKPWQALCLYLCTDPTQILKNAKSAWSGALSSELSPSPPSSPAVPTASVPIAVSAHPRHQALVILFLSSLDPLVYQLPFLLWLPFKGSMLEIVDFQSLVSRTSRPHPRTT